MAVRGITLASVAALAGALLLSACGASGEHPAAAPAKASASIPAHNAADVAFAQAMLVHHRQGVQVAGMAPTRSVSVPVKSLAATILAADQPQAATLTGWLQAWGAAVPGNGDPSGSESAATATISGQSRTVAGLMDSEAVIELGNGHGRAWDAEFLQDMSTFEAGAVQMAHTELAQGTSQDARALARRIVDTDSAEAAQMRRLLAG